MRLNAGRTLRARRRAATAAASSPVSLASRASENPIAFNRRNGPAVAGSPRARTSRSMSTMPRIWARNHGSIRHEAWICSSLMPSRIAWATVRRRCGVGVPSAARKAFLSSPWSSPSIGTSSRPVRPVSSERSAFWSDSWNVRPIAIASPTDFIDVVRTESAPGNFSKAKRGIFVTM